MSPLEARNIVGSFIQTTKREAMLCKGYKVDFEGRDYTSIEQGDWTDKHNRTYWYVLFTSDSDGHDGLILQQFDGGIVAAHCPMGPDDTNMTAVRWLVSSLVSHPRCLDCCTVL